jgi:hypothetical protein
MLCTSSPPSVRRRWPRPDDFDARRVWLGPDDRGVDLEIVALVLPAELLVIHVIPTALRRKP